VLPICASADVSELALGAAAEALTAAHLSGGIGAEAAPEDRSFTFAVSHHCRGCDATLVGELLPRADAIRAVAAGVERACASAAVSTKVSLTAPQHALCVEVLPVLCGDGGKVAPIALLTLLPQRLLVLKPRLCIKSLRG
jgi:hypothetical protein